MKFAVVVEDSIGGDEIKVQVGIESAAGGCPASVLVDDARRRAHSPVEARPQALFEIYRGEVVAHLSRGIPAVGCVR